MVKAVANVQQLRRVDVVQADNSLHGARIGLGAPEPPRGVMSHELRREKVRDIARKFAPVRDVRQGDDRRDLCEGNCIQGAGPQGEAGRTVVVRELVGADAEFVDLVSCGVRDPVRSAVRTP